MSNCKCVRVCSWVHGQHQSHSVIACTVSLNCWSMKFRLQVSGICKQSKFFETWKMATLGGRLRKARRRHTACCLPVSMPRESDSDTKRPRFFTQPVKINLLYGSSWYLDVNCWFDMIWLIKGSLEVKLPTLWKVEKQRREESEERRYRCAKC